MGANTISVADFPEIWAKEQQQVFYKTNVASKICDMSPMSQLKSGDRFNKPYRGALTAQAITRGTNMTLDTLTDTIEYLDVNKQFGTAFEYHKFDDIQSAYDLAVNYGKDSGEALSNMVDANVLAEALNASSTVTAGTLTTSTVVSNLSAVKKALKKLNVNSTNLYGVISPEFEDIITQYVEGRETAMGDKIGENGFIGMYMGIKFYVSNQLTSTAVLSLATDFTATDTVVIGGVTFTAQTTIGSTAGNFLVGTSADTSRAVLAAFINDPLTTSANQIALSAADGRAFTNFVSAVNDDTANTLTVTYKGIGVLDVSETLTDGTDGWIAASQLQHNLFGVVGNPTLVIQRKPSIVEVQQTLQLAKNYLNGVLFGSKTFQESAKQMVDLTIRCDAYNA